MIIGIGTDLVKVTRVGKACENEAFLTRIFTEEERKEAGSLKSPRREQSLAADFAGKEAVAKALGSGFSGIGPEEIAILRNEKGAPFVVLSGKAKERMEALGGTKIFISLSHEKEAAVAFVVIEAEERNENG